MWTVLSDYIPCQIPCTIELSGSLTNVLIKKGNLDMETCTQEECNVKTGVMLP